MLYAIVAVLALILDQAVKYWTTVNIVVDTGEAKLIPGFIHFVNVHNTGAAFSILEGARWFFIILCIVFVLIVVYALTKELITHPVCRWAAVIVLAGAIGNCIDRIVCGYVVDMLEFVFLIFHRRFPVFNIADIYITLGVIVFCVALLLEKPADKRKPAPAKPAPAKAGEQAGDAAPAPKQPRAARPPRRKRRKIEIPVFEKHEQPVIPAMDPNDPFAEWEKRTTASAAPAEAPVPEPQPEPEPAAVETPVPPVTTVYTQPEAAVSAEPVEQAEPTPVTPVAPAEPVEPAAPAEPAATVGEFDLDSILAEFKDL